MKCKNKFLLLIIPTFLLSGCGYGLKEIYPGEMYNSVLYEKNFYRDWNDDINYRASKNKISNVDEVNKVLDKNEDFVFTSYNDDTFHHVEPNADKYSYTDGYNEEKKFYGDVFKLSNIDESFKYGYTSKLFNGQMFCNGYYELARVQIDEGGFGMRFSKEIGQYSYFALNFKSSLDYRRDGVSTNIPAHNSSINLIINFYLKEDNETYKRVPVTYQIDDIPTNMSERLDYSNYTFFGFSLDKIKIDRCVGISIEYELLSDEYITLHPNEGWKHCLLLYELFLPYSTWH